MINSIFSLPFLPEAWGRELKIPTLESPCWFLLVPSSKSHLISRNSGTAEKSLLRITKYTPLSAITQDIPRVFGGLCQEWGTKTKQYFLLYHNITEPFSLI